MSTEKTNTENRRAAFRIEDDITLRIRILDDVALEAIVADFDGFRKGYCMKSHVQHQISLRRPHLAQIKKSKADIANYLSSLEELLVELAERVDRLSVVDTTGIEMRSCAVLSVTGIRFETTAPLISGQSIELGLFLSTVDTQIVTIGSVKEIHERQEGKFDVLVLFTHIHSEDADMVAQHLANLQRLQLQARREANRE